MKFGFMLPQFGVMATHETMLSMAQLAEEQGFESVWAADHVIMPTRISTPYPYSKSGEYITDPKGAHLEPFTILSFVAGCTRRIRLGFTVIVAPYRNPIVTGKMMASLDVLSNGRLIVGVGAGWLEEEFQALEVPFAKRWARTEEHIRIWKELWTAEEPQFDGQFYHFADVQCRPQPLQKPHPPITIGDGWQVVSEHPDDVYSTEGDLAKDLASLKRMAEEAGRDFQTIEITAVIIAGTAEGVLRDIAQYERLGVSRLILDFPSFVSDPQEMAAILEKVASEAALPEA